MSDHATRRLGWERRRLEAARELLRDGAGPGAELRRPAEHSGSGAHLADTASDTLDREVELSVNHAVEQELLEIAAAEARIDAGTYGRCEICGEAIDAERLRALPWATRCLSDQVQAETIDESLRADVLHGPSEAEALDHSDLIPDEDAVDGTELSAEEGALHLQP
jgi:RNA polymerase-binding transcription factor DksA